VNKDILLLTGWGATCTVWEPIIPALSDGCQVNCVTPSWLNSHVIEGSLGDVDDYIEKLALTITRPINIVAWSMGGLLAIKLATRFPDGVENICFISSVPKFVCADNVNAGIDYQWFNKFLDQYQSQPLATLNKFLALQVKNDSSVRTCLRLLKKACDFENYDLIECGFGLKLLQQLDLSDQLKVLECNTAFIHGSSDAVVNLQSVEYAAKISNSPLSIISGAGHTPHVSQPDAVADIIKNYLYQ
jgi:pimeloyl-[acyl-carrier protein] methyl ester esterase